jgi:hypothetical protein
LFQLFASLPACGKLGFSVIDRRARRGLVSIGYIRGVFRIGNFVVVRRFEEGKIRPPITVPGMNIRLFDVERLRRDWQALLEEAENGSANPWDES